MSLSTFTLSTTITTFHLQDFFAVAPNRNFVSFKQSLSIYPPPASDNHHSTSSLRIWLHQVLHRSGILQYLSFCDWLISLNMSSGFIHVIACVRISFLRLNVILLWYMSRVFIHSSADGHWGASTSWLLWIMLLWTWVYTHLFETLLSVLLDMYTDAIAGSYDNSFLEESPYCFPQYSSCPILYSYQQYIRVPISPHPHQYLVFSFCLFLIIAILMTASQMAPW